MKIKQAFLIISFLFFFHNICSAQKRGNVWCFGHEAAINFNNGIPVPDSSSVISRGSCASICDTSGNLLIYTAYDTSAYISGSDPVKIYGSDHMVILNGDSIKGGGWYFELVIIPDPSLSSRYYLFNIGVTLDYGIYYSVIDMSLNGGLGGVIQKNIQLQNFANVDCLTAIKHGNGRDWWVFFRKYNQFGGNDVFYRYLVSPNGISSVYNQTIGSLNSTNLGNIEFNVIGDKMMFTNFMGQMEYYDFDRCTGLLSNPQTIFSEQTGPFSRLFWDGQFSPSGNLFYTTLISIPNMTDSCYLIQYDLAAANIPMSADTLLVGLLMNNTGGVKLGPDNKIYVSSVYNNFVTSSYPYPDTVYSVYNSNLSVINSPDNLGVACDFQPYSFYLGGKRSYVGLPNNPDYDLGPLGGSICDTLVNVPELNQNPIKPNLFVYYSQQWNIAFINADKLIESDYLLSIYDLNGKEIFHETGNTKAPFFTKNLNCAGYSKGLYIVNFKCGKSNLSTKFIIQ